MIYFNQTYHKSSKSGIRPASLSPLARSSAFYNYGKGFQQVVTLVKGSTNPYTTW